MKRSEFRDLYAQSLLEAVASWPELYPKGAHQDPEQRRAWADRVMSLIPLRQVTMTDKKSSFAILCRKLGIRQTVKNIQAALAACEEG